MNRCLLPSLLALPLLAAALPGAADTAHILPAVQTVPSHTPAGSRNFPPHAKLGMLHIEQVPQAHINGQSIRTAPGFRLFNTDNRLIFAHSVQGQTLPVAFTQEASTQWLHTAWILTPQEQDALAAQR